MSTFTFHITSSQLADPDILQKLAALGEALKPKIPTAEELRVAKLERFESKKVLFKGIAGILNTQIEKRTGKKLGITDKCVFEIFEVMSGKPDFNNIFTTWMLPIWAAFSELPSTSTSTSTSTAETTPSMFVPPCFRAQARSPPSRNTSTETPAPAPAPVNPAPAAIAGDLAPLGQFLEMFGGMIFSGMNAVAQQNQPGALPSQVGPEQFLSAIFGNPEAEMSKEL